MRLLPPCMAVVLVLLGATARAQAPTPAPASAAPADAVQVAPQAAAPPVASPPPPVAAPPPAPAPVAVPMSPDLITSDGYPRTLHLQLTRGLNQPYTVRVTSGDKTLTCPFPLTATAGCDLTPVKAGDAQYSVLENGQEVHAGVLTIPVMGGTLKLTRQPEEWIRRLGYALVTFGGFALVSGGSLYGIDHYGPDDNAAIVTMVLSVPVIVAGILLAVLPRAPELRYLAADEPLVPAPAPPSGGAP